MRMEEYFGLAQTHLTDWQDTRFSEPKIWPLHRDCVSDWQAMITSAANAGIYLLPVSGYRNFDRQLDIWNAKFDGTRLVHDDRGVTLKRNEYSDEQWCDNIMRYSALPGLSRHHWGTDIDVFDGDSLQKGHRPQMREEEFCAGGPCADLNNWLETNAAQFGFFRPYDKDRGGVAMEPWHLSYAPVSRYLIKELDIDALRQILIKADIKGGRCLLPKLEEVVNRYALAVATPP